MVTPAVAMTARQPSQGTPVNRSNKIGAGAVAIVTPTMDINWATGKQLTRGNASSYATMTAGGMRALSFNKNFWLETETLPAVGTNPYVLFWMGWPTGLGCVLGTAEAGFAVGTSNNTLGICTNLGSNRSIGNSPYGPNMWGCSNNTWSTIWSAGDTLAMSPTGAPYFLMVVRKSNGDVQFWRNGVITNTVNMTVTSVPAFKLEVGTFVAQSNWNSQNNTVLAGLSILPTDPTNAELTVFSADAWGTLFSAGPNPMLMMAALAAASIGAPAIWSSPDTLAGADSTAATYFTAAQVAEILAAANTPSAAATVSSSGSDTLAGADAPAAIANVSGALSDALAGSDAASGQAQFVGSGSDAMAAADTATAAASLVAQILDSLAAADTNSTGAGALTASGSDALAAVEAVSALATFAAAGADALVAADSTPVVAVFSTSATDALAGSDFQAQGSTTTASSSDSMAGADAGSSVQYYNAAMLESVASSDAISAALSAAATTIESMGAADAVVISLQSSASSSDVTTLLVVSDAAWTTSAGFADSLAAVVIQDIDTSVVILPRTYALAGVSQHFPLESTKQTYPLE